MESSRRNYNVGIPPPSPRLQRSRSSAPAISHVSVPETHPFISNTGILSRTRSKSSAKTRAKENEENQNPKIEDSFRKNDLVVRFKEAREDIKNFAGILHRNRITSPAKAVEAQKSRKLRSISGSPSAWALSPGRSTPPLSSPAPETLGSTIVKQKPGGVLRFFRQKKMPSAREESVHQIRVLSTRLMQWRLVNARAETAVAAGKSVAEKKVFNVWLGIFQLRKSIGEKRIQKQKLMSEIKLNRILGSQIQVLNRWEKIDKKNLEAVEKSARLLTAVSIRVPLVGVAKPNMISIYRSISTAMNVLNGIEASIGRFFTQMEKISTLLREFMEIVKQEREGVEELIKIITVAAPLEAQESSLKVHLIQVAHRHSLYASE